jgi:hypothetical protein
MSSWKPTRASNPGRVLGTKDVAGSAKELALTTWALPIPSAIARRTRTSRSAGFRLGISVRKPTAYWGMRVSAGDKAGSRSNPVGSANEAMSTWWR